MTKAAGDTWFGKINFFAVNTTAFLYVAVTMAGPSEVDVPLDALCGKIGNDSLVPFLDINKSGIRHFFHCLHNRCAGQTKKFCQLALGRKHLSFPQLSRSHRIPN